MNTQEYVPKVAVTPQKIRDLVMGLVQSDLDGETEVNQNGDTVSCFTFLVEALDCCQESIYILEKQAESRDMWRVEHWSYYQAIQEGCNLAAALLDKKYPLPPPAQRLSAAWRRRYGS